MTEAGSVRFHVERAYAAGAPPLPFAAADDFQLFVAKTYRLARDRAEQGSSQNPYALLPDTLAFLTALLDALSPKLVVEFGSGESTTLFGKWAAGHRARLISVEHDYGWVANVESRLGPDERAVVKMVHAPLRLIRRGLRQFLSYRSLEALAAEAREADLFLLDGPHMSGRELVLYFVLSHCRPGAVIVVDDFRHYSVRDMLAGVPRQVASCFVGEAIDDNTHGLYVLRCISSPPASRVPALGLRSILRSYWRCLRDFRQYGTGTAPTR
jgi:predicted O-methyltransferase YrrM